MFIYFYKWKIGNFLKQNKNDIVINKNTKFIKMKFFEKKVPSFSRCQGFTLDRHIHESLLETHIIQRLKKIIHLFENFTNLVIILTIVSESTNN